jgi:competence protein CoiA
MIPHFAHIVLSDCQSSFSERESPIHLKGKLQLAEFFQQHVSEVVVESYIPHIAQRPDILVKIKRQSYAIEFQCSTIPIHIRDSRNNGYLKMSIQPVWILRTFDHPDVPSHGITTIQLPHFRQAFIQHNEHSGAFLLSYDPNKLQFTYYAHLMHLQGTRFVAKICNLPIDAQSFPFRLIKPLTIKEKKVYWSIFQHQRIRFLRTRLLTSKKGVNDPVLRICYMNRIQPVDLPLFIGVPLGSAKSFRMTTVEWQLLFIHMCMEQCIQFNDISDDRIEVFIHQNLHEGGTETAKELCLKYTHFLMQLNLKVDSSLLIQKVGEEQILEIFLQQIVAKPTEY